MLVTGEEIARLRDGARPPQLRSEMAVRILQEAYDQNVILSFADVGLLMCQSPVRISQLVREYHAAHPGQFIPHCGSVLDKGSTRTHPVHQTGGGSMVYYQVLRYALARYGFRPRPKPTYR